MRTILVALFLLVFFIFSIPILIAEWFIAKFNQPWADITQLRIVQWAFNCICFIAGVKLEVIGEENVPKDESVLYIGNHRGFFDILVTYSRCPNLTGYISKEVIKKVPILSTFLDGVDGNRTRQSSFLVFPVFKPKFKNTLYLQGKTVFFIESIFAPKPCFSGLYDTKYDTKSGLWYTAAGGSVAVFFII